MIHGSLLYRHVVVSNFKKGKIHHFRKSLISDRHLLRAFFSNLIISKPNAKKCVLSMSCDYYQLQQSSNNVTNTTFTPHPLTPLEVYHILNFFTTSPYIIIQSILFVLSIVVYIYKFKEMKRNQHVLFIMLFVLQSDIMVDLILRVNNEANAYEHSRNTTNGVEDYLLTGIAVAHRCIINFLVFWQLWIMYFLCSVL